MLFFSLCLYSLKILWLIVTMQLERFSMKYKTVQKIKCIKTQKTTTKAFIGTKMISTNFSIKKGIINILLLVYGVCLDKSFCDFSVNKA